MSKRSFVFASLLLLAGCLEVESLEVRAVADAKNDRLDLMIVSRGVSSSATSADGVAKDLANLRRCRDVAAIPWPGLGVIDVTRPSVDEQKGRDADEEKWMRFVPFFDIEAGAFFTDEQGRLCFYQFVRIHRPKEFAAQCSRLLLAAWLAERKVSPATRALLEQAAKEERPVVTIDGAGICVRRPLSEEDHRVERATFWRNVARSATPPAKSEARASSEPIASAMQVMRDNDFAMVRRRDVTEYVVGEQGSDACDYRMPGEKYKDNLMIAFSADEPRPPTVTQALIDKQFAAFHEREARLPPAFVEMKKRALPPTGR